MTPEMEAIERVRRVLPAVTPGPWAGTISAGCVCVTNSSGAVMATMPDNDLDDAEFIALSRTAVPALLSALSSRDEELSTAREEIARKDALIAELVRALREAKDTLSEDLMSLTRHDIFALQESVAAALTRAKEESNG